MVYIKLSERMFRERLRSGCYKSCSCALKAVGKTSLPQEAKESLVDTIYEYFSSPAVRGAPSIVGDGELIRQLVSALLDPELCSAVVDAYALYRRYGEKTARALALLKRCERAGVDLEALAPAARTKEPQKTS